MPRSSSDIFLSSRALSEVRQTYAIETNVAVHVVYVREHADADNELTRCDWVNVRRSGCSKVLAHVCAFGVRCAGCLQAGSIPVAPIGFCSA